MRRLSVCNVLARACALTREQRRADVERWVRIVDPSLPKVRLDRAYAENCNEWSSVWDTIKDEFFIAHIVGWYFKALLLRDPFLCWILSILFEVWEYTFEHMLPNFAECWWDHLILDILVCNWLGIWLGLKTSKYLEQKKFDWAGYKAKGGTSRVAVQLLPHNVQPYKWKILSSWRRLGGVFFLLAVQSGIELNNFWLKWFLNIPPPHWIMVVRVVMWGFIGAPAIAEFYHYIDGQSDRFGTMAWLCALTEATETLVVLKYAQEWDWANEWPSDVIWAWAIGATVSVVAGILWYSQFSESKQSSKPKKKTKAQ
jgi:phosphatidylserine synthase 2